MKRTLFDTVKIVPYDATAAALDRRGYESAVLALSVEAGKTAAVTVTTCDTETGTFVAVEDSRIFIDNPVNSSKAAAIKNEGTEAVVANLDIDLIGCKQFIKITVTDGTPFAVALGDATDYPVS